MTHRKQERTLSRFLIALVAGAGLVVPFVALEVVNRRAFREEFPLALFTFMSLHSMLIVLTLMPAMRRLWSEGSPRALRAPHWVGLAVSVLLAAVYVNVVVDQWPCFVGVPGCD